MTDASNEQTVVDEISSPLRLSDLPTIFADVTPVPQDDGPTAVARIDYPPAFTQAYDTWRALIQRDECHSIRALRLSTLCLQHNPANYTLWHFRRTCWKHIVGVSWQTALQVDLPLASILGGDNPKNYQIWYHRRALLEELILQQQQEKDTTVWRQYASSELEYIGTVLQVDAKNYHAWSHRQWLVQCMAADDAASIWSDELRYTEHLLEIDVRNNSAWNHRWFVLHAINNNNTSIDVPTHVDFCFAKAREDPYNECPWRFLVALLKHHANHDEKDIHACLSSVLEQTWRVHNEVVKTCGEGPSSHLLAAVVDILCMQSTKDAAQQALETCLKLPQIDPVREKYWTFRSQQIRVQAEKLDAK
jgi:protein farnesyltransferase/geranylgeranyltransferase type-1 subunit alpha